MSESDDPGIPREIEEDLDPEEEGPEAQDAEVDERTLRRKEQERAEEGSDPSSD
jgi:hypothetical protein